VSDLVIRTHVDLKGLDNLIAAAGGRADIALSRALNRAGVPVANSAKRTIRKVLGLRAHPYAKGTPAKAVTRSTSVRKASAGRLEFSLSGFGKGLPAIYYQPKEAPAGASINWLGARKAIARSFYLGGKFPRRRKSRISHVVWRRTGTGKWTLDRPLGPGVPEAMQTSSVKAGWEQQAAARLPHHLREALYAVLRGY
jgi:hypothetical protein